MTSQYSITIINEVLPRLYQSKSGIQRHKQVEAICHCGRVFTCLKSALKIGRIRSCGCSRRKINTSVVVIPEKPRLVNYNGIEFPLRQLTDLLGLDYKRTELRIDRDWSLLDALRASIYKTD